MTARGTRRRMSLGTKASERARARAVTGVVMALGCLLLSGCAVIAGAIVGGAASSAAAGIAGDAAYSAAFRTKMEDPSKLSADELGQLQLVRLYNSDEGLIYTSKGEAKGLSCKLSAGIRGSVWRPALSELNGNTPEEAAMMQLKIKALKAGGNAILSPACLHNDGVDWGNNCFESWVCTGQAVQVE